MNEYVGSRNEIISSTNFSNFPNPFSSVTTFSVSHPLESMSIEIFNLQGQIVYSRNLLEGEGRFVWNADGLSGGIYFACLKSESTVLSSTKLVLLD